MRYFILFCLLFIESQANENLLSWTLVDHQGTSMRRNVSLNEGAPTSRIGDDCGCGKSIYGLTSCGDQRRDMNRIIGGRFANSNEIPWQARVVICKADRSCFGCGGSLINHRYVLTAAHCLKDNGVFAQIDRVTVYLGVRDLRNTGQFTKTERVESFNIHGNYDDKIAKNDIALIKLKRYVHFNNGVRPICLPRNSEHLYTGQWAVASGWGQTQQGGKGGSNVLKRTNLRVLKNSDQYCINGASLGRPPWKKQMCAHREGTDTCGGDSGGPLALPEGGRCTLAGIVSYGLDCALTYHAGVYTRVSEYLFWIRHIAKDGGCFGSGGSTKPKHKYCNMRCLWGRVTATYYVTNQRHKVICKDGICYAENPNVDLCKIYNHPCGHVWI